MINISKSVSEIVESDPLLYEVVSSGLGNFSAIARTIKPIIEEKTSKSVKLPSIIIALSRIATELLKKESSFSSVQKNLKDFRIRFPVFQLVYEKTPKLIQKLSESTDLEDTLISVTVADNEINIVSTIDYSVLFDWATKPKKIIGNIALLAIRFDEKLVYTPGLLHYITTLLFARNINIIDVVSTYTELSILVDSSDIGKVTQLVQS